LQLLLGARDDALAELTVEALAGLTICKQYSLGYIEYEGPTGMPQRLMPRIVEMAQGHGFSGFDAGGGYGGPGGSEVTGGLPCRQSMVEALQDVEDYGPVGIGSWPVGDADGTIVFGKPPLSAETPQRVPNQQRTSESAESGPQSPLPAMQSAYPQYSAADKGMGVLAFDFISRRAVSEDSPTPRHQRNKASASTKGSADQQANMSDEPK